MTIHIGRYPSNKYFIRGQTKQVLYLLIYIGLALTMGCSKPDRDDEAVALSTKIVSEGLSDANYALERVDSAEQVGVFTAVRANTIKAIIYTNADRRRMAAYYAIAAEAGQAVTTSADSNLYCKVRYILANGAYINGEYGKSLTIAKVFWVVAFCDHLIGLVTIVK